MTFKLLAFLTSDGVSQIHILIALPTDKTAHYAPDQIRSDQIRSECSGNDKYLLYQTLPSNRHALNTPVPFESIQVFDSLTLFS